MIQQGSGKKLTALCSACGRSWRTLSAATRCTCGTDQAPKLWGQKYSIHRSRKGGVQVVEVVFAAKTAGKVVERYEFRK